MTPAKAFAGGGPTIIARVGCRCAASVIALPISVASGGKTVL
jgi:hypothetical protein